MKQLSLREEEKHLAEENLAKKNSQLEVSVYNNYREATRSNTNFNPGPRFKFLTMQVLTARADAMSARNMELEQVSAHELF